MRFQKSHEQLPDHNPIFGAYYKDRGSDTYHPQAIDQKIHEKDLRMVPKTDLFNFKFNAVSMPTPEKNMFELKEGSKVLDAIKNKDAITLKVLADRGELEKLSDEQIKAYEAVAGENGDTFSTNILKNIKRPHHEIRVESVSVSPKRCIK